MSYKTLILIDNSSELTTLNQEIIKETIKYLVSHLEEDNRTAIAVTGEKADYLTDYEDSVNTKLKRIDELEFTDVNVSPADILMEVLLDWKEGDLAYRDIVYVSGKSAFFGSDYTEEELLFEVNGKQYPIYSLACAQDENNACIKSMNSLSRISGGVCVSTEDAKSDAEVEKQLAEKIMEAMNERRLLEEEEYGRGDENERLVNDSEETTEQIYDDETSDILDITDEYSNENVVYEVQNENEIIPSVNIAIPVITASVFLLIVVVTVVIHNTKTRKDEERYKEAIRKAEDKHKQKRIPFEEDDGNTVCLNDGFSDEEGGTRLLYQTTEGVEITLEDRSDPTKFFRAHVRDTITIGRNVKTCDIAISYDDSISSRHCELSFRENALYCRDLGSSNGTMINQKKVYQEVKIESGDILRIGRLSFFIQILGGNYGGV